MFSQEILKNENSKKLKKTVTSYISSRNLFFANSEYHMILTDENR